MHENLITKINSNSLVAKIKSLTSGYDVYIVGGFIPSIILGKEITDIDFIIKDNFSEVLKILEKELGRKAILLGKHHPDKTYRFPTKLGLIDITECSGDFEKNLMTRDLTINSISYSLSRDEFIDPLDGLGDISKKILRFTSEQSVLSDPVRLLRILRFISKFSDFEIEDESRNLIMKYANHLKTSAPERIGFELKELFSGTGFIKGFEYFVQFGLFNELFPELTPAFQNPEINQRVQLSFNILEEYFTRNIWEYKFDKEDKITLRLSLLLHLLSTNSDFTSPVQKEYYANFIDNILTKLKEFNFPVNVKHNIKPLLQNWDKIFLIYDQPTPSLYRINKLFSLFKDRIILLITFSSALLKSQEIEDEDKYRDFLLYTEEIYDEFKTSKYISSPLLISGKDLLDIGYEEGLEIGRALHLISKKFEVGEITDYNDALDYAEDILAYRKSPTVRYKIASYFFIVFLILYSILGFMIMKSEKKFQNAFRILDTMGNRKALLSKGIKEIQAAIKFFPYDYRYYSLIADCYQVKFILGTTNEKTIMVEKMLRNRQRAIDLAEALPYLSADLGKTYEILGDLPMALLEYNRAMEKNPLKLEYRMKVIELFKRRGDYKFARDVIEEGLFLLPENKKLKMELEYVRGKIR